MNRLALVFAGLVFSVVASAQTATTSAAPAAAQATPVGAPVAAPPPTVLVTGTNRGIGLEFARQYAEKGWRVIATARVPEQAPELQAIAAKHPNLTIERLDVMDSAQIAALAQKYAGQPIDVLLNNAGLLGDREKQVLGKIDYATFQEVLRVNTFAPLEISQAFLPNVQASQQKKIVAITSGLSSITNAIRFGNLYVYRISKAGLNMGMRTLQAEVKPKGVKVGIMAPGVVETRLLRQSGFAAQGMEAAKSAAAVMKNIENLNSQDANLILFDGSIVPW